MGSVSGTLSVSARSMITLDALPLTRPANDDTMRRRLFLDDDPARAAVFLARHPDAVWVQTVPECLGRLADRWHEIHLDHDLGGEHYVDPRREDCGMEVVRWLTRERRRHLSRTRFTVHSHNMVAAYEMAFRLRQARFRVQARPFGLITPAAPPVWLDAWRRLRFSTALKVRRVAARFRRFTTSDPESNSP